LIILVFFYSLFGRGIIRFMTDLPLQLEEGLACRPAGRRCRRGSPWSCAFRVCSAQTSSPSLMDLSKETGTEKAIGQYRSPTGPSQYVARRLHQLSPPFKTFAGAALCLHFKKPEKSLEKTDAPAYPCRLTGRGARDIT